MSFEYKTTDQLRQDILDNVSNDYEKSKGNLTYDIPAATAIVLNKTYDKLKELTDKGLYGKYILENYSEEEVLEKRLDWTRKSIKDIEFIEKKFYENSEND